jgi:hypothetical protein
MSQAVDVTLRATLRHGLNEFLKTRPGPVAVSLSGGIDSASLLRVLQDIGRQVVAYSFTLAGHLSSDFSRARQIARTFDCRFVPIFLPTDPEALSDDLDRLIDLGCKKKTAIECLWPYLYLVPAVEERALVVGHCADGHFGVSKKAMIHYRYDTALLDGYRHKLFDDPGYAQTDLLGKLCGRYGLPTTAPYRADPVRAFFEGRSWREVNTPRQKEAIRREFPELDALCIGQHQNLQKGDSGIAALFEKTFKTDGCRSVVGAYNTRRRERSNAGRE